MKAFFEQSATHKIDNATASTAFEKLPEIIREHTDWEYAYQATNTGCLLKPTFRNMQYRNCFIPEIDISVSCDEAHTTLHISGRPVKSVRIFMTLFYAIWSVLSVWLIIQAITSQQGILFIAILPLVLGAFFLLIEKFSLQATFNSIVKAIQKEFP
jgi:hypothetical protein